MVQTLFGSQAEAAAAGPAAGPAPGGEAFALAFAHPPHVIAATLRRALAPPADPSRPRRLVRWLLVPALLGLGVFSLQLDRWLDFPHGAFGWLVPFAWLGVFLVMHATRPRAPTYPRWARNRPKLAGCLVLGLLFFPVVGCWRSFSSATRDSRSLGSWVFVTLVVLFAAWLHDRLWRGGQAQTELARLQAAADVVEALADDAAPGKPASGWLDLSGAQQERKKVRSGTTATGAAVSVYADEWLRLRLALRDGNRLRVSAADRVKARDGRWKRSSYSNKNKWKPGRTDTLSSVEIQLGVNPAAYRVKPEGEPAAARVTQGKDGAPALALALSASAAGFDPAEVVRGVAALYGRLERIAAPGG
jgi:hypothetical protein